MNNNNHFEIKDDCLIMGENDCMSTCRICLSTDAADMECIFENVDEQLTEKIYDCIQIKVINIKGLPSSICVLCKFKIVHYWQFKKQCQKSVKILNKKYTSILLNKLKSKNIVSIDDQKEEEYMPIAVQSDNAKEIAYNEKTKHIEKEEIIGIHKKKAEEQDDVQYKCNTEEIIINVLSDNPQEQTEITYDLTVQNDDNNSDIVDENLSRDKSLVSVKKKLLKCQYCGKYFRRTYNLNNHLKLHNSMNLYKCEYCLKCFTQIDDLKMHYSTHTDKKHFKIFKCYICKNAYNNSNALMSHMSEHKVERAYKCEICDKNFEFSFNLKTHKLIQHRQNRGFKCQYCNKLFLTNDYLKKHELDHTQQQYVCEICGKSCKRSYNLQVHRKIHVSK